MKIDFVVSLPYNELMAKAFCKKNFKVNLTNIKEWTRGFEKEWRKHERKILNKIEEYSGIKWKEDKIKCYVVGNSPISISSPLTIPIFKNKRVALKCLVHELIHVNIAGVNKPLLSPKSKEAQTFRHIGLYLIYNQIMKKFFPGEKIYLRSELENPRYKKAIEISKKLEPKWKKSNKNIYEFMKYYLKGGFS